MKKLIFILMLFVIPIVVFSQYITPKTYPKSSTSGNATQYKNSDTVWTSVINITPGIYGFGISATDSVNVKLYLFGRYNELNTGGEIYADSASIAGLTAKNGWKIDTIGTYTSTARGSAYVFYNKIIPYTNIRIMAIFQSSGSGTTRTSQYYKLFFNRQTYKYE